MPAEAEELITDTISRIDDADLQALVVDASRGTVTGEALDAIAERYGIEDFHQRYQSIVSELTNQAVQELSTAGADVASVVEWAKTRFDNNFLAEGQRKHWATGSLQMYRQIAKAYKAAHPRSTGDS